MRIALVRYRNSILEALEIFRDLFPGFSMGHMISFLYACENEGLTLLDLSQVSGFYLATASRSIRAFCDPNAEGATAPALGLIELRPSRQGKKIYLTDAGQKFRAQLEAIIASASAISPSSLAADVAAA